MKLTMKTFLQYNCHGSNWLTRIGSGLGFWRIVKGYLTTPAEETCDRCKIRIKASHMVWKFILNTRR